MHVPYKFALGAVALAAAAFAVIHWRSADQPASGAGDRFPGPGRHRAGPAARRADRAFRHWNSSGPEYGLDPEPGDGCARGGRFCRRPDGQKGRHPRQDRPSSLPGRPGAGARTISQGHCPSRPGAIRSRALSNAWQRGIRSPCSKSPTSSFWLRRMRPPWRPIRE